MSYNEVFNYESACAEWTKQLNDAKKKTQAEYFAYCDNVPAWKIAAADNVYVNGGVYHAKFDLGELAEAALAFDAAAQPPQPQQLDYKLRRQFDGWRIVEPHEIGMREDVWLSKYDSSPEEASHVGCYAEEPVSNGAAFFDRFTPYRRTRPKRLPGNAHYSKPLPLP